MKIKKSLVLTIIVGLSILESCKKEDACEQIRVMEQNNGIIETSVDIVCSPISDNGVVIQELIINDDSTYQQLFKNIPITNSLNCKQPTIDFSVLTLLGYRTFSGGCNHHVERDLFRDESNKRYNYVVRIRSCGTCNGLLYATHNWVTVPKLPQGWTVSFEQIRE